MPRTSDEQHGMLQHAIKAVLKASEPDPYAAEQQRHAATRAAVRNQEVQALTLIALELRALRLLMDRGSLCES